MKIDFKELMLNRWAALSHDIFMVVVAWYLAYLFRFDLGDIPLEYHSPAIKYLAILLPIQVILFWTNGLYKGVWRFSSVPDLLRILKSTVMGTVLSIVVIFIVFRLEGLPRSVPILYLLFLMFFLGGSRLAYRWLKDNKIRITNGARVLIVGAGNTGELLVRDMLRNSDDAYQPVAFVDDGKNMRGKEIHGVPVRGVTQDLPALCEELLIDVIVLAIPSASLKERKRIIDICEVTAIPFRTVPQLDSLISGQVSVNQLREVSIEDLLGRDPVKLDWEGIRSGLNGKTVMVSGAGGSIGSELCRQLARLSIDKLILVENSEYNLYQIELELKQSHPDLLLYACLVDIKDEESIERLFKRYSPSVVFHAAAYKHVPMMEYHVREAVYNNIIGTRIMADMANQYRASEFIMISTDKAVNPTNVMGTTKRIAEIYCQNLNAKSDTKYITVRFGNVLGSAGSVVPLFRKQIIEGGPVTVTHRDIERFFMTIPEACQLIMQASILAKGGEIFVLDMGEPIKITYLAEQMILLSGRVPNEDIDIEYTGLRPGEKLYEELFHEQEELSSTSHEKILLAQHRLVDFNMLCEAIDEMKQAIPTYNENLLVESMAKLVPESTLKPVLN